MSIIIDFTPGEPTQPQLIVIYPENADDLQHLIRSVVSSITSSFRGPLGRVFLG